MHLTIDEFKEVLPVQVRKSVNHQVLDIVNNVIGDPEFLESFRDNLVGYQSVLSEGKYKLTNYVEAVKYVSHKLMGRKNFEAYRMAFPEKIAEFKRRGVPDSEVSKYVHAFNRSKLVAGIIAQTMIPTHILNADAYQEAINIQLDMARNAKSEKVRSDAANSLLVQLKPPEVKKLELDIKMKEDSSIQALRDATMEMVAQTRQAIQAGAITALDSAHSKLILDGEFTDVT